MKTRGHTNGGEAEGGERKVVIEWEDVELKYVSIVGVEHDSSPPCQEI